MEIHKVVSIYRIEGEAVWEKFCSLPIIKLCVDINFFSKKEAKSFLEDLITTNSKNSETWDLDFFMPFSKQELEKFVGLEIFPFKNPAQRPIIENKFALSDIKETREPLEKLDSLLENAYKSEIHSELIQKWAIPTFEEYKERLFELNPKYIPVYQLDYEKYLRPYKKKKDSLLSWD